MTSTNSSANNGPTDLDDVIDGIEDAVEDGSAKVRDIVQQFGGRSFGPLLAVAMIFAITPLGAIPTVPTMIGVLTISISGQILFGRQTPWLPDFLLDRTISADKVRGARRFHDKWLKRLDRIVTTRFTVMTGPTGQKLCAGIIIILAAMMMPLEAVPFAVILPASVILIFALGLAARDGLIVGIAWVLSVVALGLAGYWLVQLWG